MLNAPPALQVCWVQVNPSDRGAGFKLLYVDENLRIHQTFDGLYFVQKRLA